MNTNNTQRRCRGCNNIGHNIRGCIKQIDERIILEYSRRTLMNLPTAFPPELGISISNINKLCEKYGLAFYRVSTANKLERLHRIYLQLGSQHRRNEINNNFVQLHRRPINIYRPSYLPPSNQQEVARMLGYNIYRNNNRQEEVHYQKPTLQIILDKTKFASKTDIGECPICYENCANMISTNCNHSYCQLCFNTLINSVKNCTLPCPLCRENVKDIFVFSETSSEMMMKL